MRTTAQSAKASFAASDAVAASAKLVAGQRCPNELPQCATPTARPNAHQESERFWMQVALDSRFCVKTAAARLGLSVRQLERSFKQTFGRRPKALFAEFRMTWAGRLLQETRSIKETWTTLGFNSASHFSHVFQKRYGQAPRAFLARWSPRRSRS